MKLVYIDLETSGLNEKEDEIIKFYAKKVGEKEFNELAKPSEPISYEVEMITEITNEQLKDCRKSQDVKKDFLEYIKGLLVVGNNIPFMEKFLGVSFAKKINLIKPKKLVFKQDMTLCNSDKLKNYAHYLDVCEENEKFINNFSKYFIDLIEFVKDNKEVKTSTIQREFRFGYGFVINALDILVDNGFVSRNNDGYYVYSKDLSDDSLDINIELKNIYDVNTKFLKDYSENELSNEIKNLFRDKKD